MDDSTRAVAVIGAGISGAACARELVRAGARVTIFEKARGAGGRLSVRRMLGGAVTLPTGASRLAESSHPAWAKLCTHWESSGLIRKTADGWVPLQGPNALVKDLLSELGDRAELKFATRLVRIQRRDAGVELIFEDVGGNSARLFDAVVLTAPLPQAIELLDASGLGSELTSELRAVTFTRSVVSLMALRTDALPEALARTRHVLGDSSTLDLVSKGVSWKSSDAWACEHWDSPDLESRLHAQTLAALAASGVRLGPEAVLERSFHRWKYARAMRPFSAQDHFRLKGAGAPIALAGDAFGSEDAASACISGISAARTVVKRADG